MAAAVRVTIRGFVQGVGYRAWTIREAERRGLRGWVRNRLDGSVEALFIGDEGVIAAMIAACRSGPRLAQVDDVRAHPAADDGSTGFSDLPTG
jgi:acylphosphatase